MAVKREWKKRASYIGSSWVLVGPCRADHAGPLSLTYWKAPKPSANEESMLTSFTVRLTKAASSVTHSRLLNQQSERNRQKMFKNIFIKSVVEVVLRFIIHSAWYYLSLFELYEG